MEVHIDRFLISNTFGLCTSIFLEIIKRWTAEDRVIKLTTHLRTDSELFQTLATLIEETDLTERHLTDRTSIGAEMGRKFLQEKLLSQLHIAIGRITEIGRLQLVTTRDDNRLSLELIKSVDLLLAVSHPKTDERFWISQEGRQYWQAQLNSILASNSNDRLPTDDLPTQGIARIFVIEEELTDAICSEIVKHVRANVRVALFNNILNEESIDSEFALFGDVAIRETVYTGVSKAVENVYIFDVNQIREKRESYTKWWNSAVKVTPVNPSDRASFDELKLNELLANFRI